MDRKVQCHGPQHEFFSYAIVEEFLHVSSDQNNDSDLSCLHMQCKIWLKSLKYLYFIEGNDDEIITKKEKIILKIILIDITFVLCIIDQSLNLYHEYTLNLKNMRLQNYLKPNLHHTFRKCDCAPYLNL